MSAIKLKTTPDFSMIAFRQCIQLMGFLIATGGLCGCHSSRIVTPSKINMMPDFCTPTRISTSDGKQVIYYNTDSLLNHRSHLTRDMSKKEILVANASGSLDLVNKLSGLLLDSAGRKKSYLLYTTEIEKNIALLKGEVDEVSAELACEVIRCRQLSSFLGNLNSKRNSRLTVAAIIVGSATTITPIFVKQTTPQNIVLISGGIISAGLGLLTLNPRGKLIRLVTPNNMLSDIWFGNKTSPVYPAPIWYILSDPGFSNLELLPKRVLISLRWKNFELGEAPDQQTTELLFGNGGLFDQATLDTRATMLSEVQAHVNSIKKDLDNFSYAFNNLKLKILSGMDW